MLLKSRLKEFDVIHSIGLEITLVVSALAKKLNKKHIAQTIGSDLLIYLPKKERFFGLKKWIENTDVVICNSKYLERELLKRYPGIRSEVLYRGTDLNKFARDKLKLNKTKKIVYLGGFYQRRGSGMGSDLKGGETLKGIWEYFDTIDNLDAQLILGGGESIDTDQIEWKSRLIHPERVELLGLLHPDAVPGIIQEADIILIPSKSEGLPNVAVEACASVIANNVGGIPEIVVNNLTGISLDSNDKELWIRTIEKCYRTLMNIIF